eukprot:1028253-Rhodomonas_salina.3
MDLAARSESSQDPRAGAAAHPRPGWPHRRTLIQVERLPSGVAAYLLYEPLRLGPLEHTQSHEGCHGCRKLTLYTVQCRGLQIRSQCSKNSAPEAPRNTVPGSPDTGVGTDWHMWRIWLKAVASGTICTAGRVGEYRKGQALKLRLGDEAGDGSFRVNSLPRT